MKVTGIILAGGKSSRMGTDKGLIHYKGKPMISYSIDLLSQFCDRILLSSSADIYDHLGLERIPDIYEKSGPMGGLHASLLASNTELNILLPVDAPNMPPEAIAFMLHEANLHPEKCIVPLTPDMEPLISVYPRSIIPVLVMLLKNKQYKMTTIFDHTPVHYIPLKRFPVQNAKAIFNNINTPRDLTK